MTNEQQGLPAEVQALIEATNFRGDYAGHISYLEKLSILKTEGLNTLPVADAESMAVQAAANRELEYSLVADTLGVTPDRGSIYVNDGLYSHAISLEEATPFTTTARIQTPNQMLASLLMIIDENYENTSLSPFSFSAFARTLRGVPVFDRMIGDDETGVTELYFRGARGDDRKDLFAFQRQIAELGNTVIGKENGFSVQISEQGVKLTIPTRKLLAAETYRHPVRPFAAGLGFGSPDGRFVRQYDFSNSALGTATDDEIFAMLQVTETKLVPGIQEAVTVADEKRDALALSAEDRNYIIDLMNRFIKHERGTIETPLFGYLQLADLQSKKTLTAEAIAALTTMLVEGKPITNIDALQTMDSGFADLILNLMSRWRFYVKRNIEIKSFETARDEFQQLYPVHAGYALVEALKQSVDPYKELFGKEKIDVRGGVVQTVGVHPELDISINLSYLGGPADTTLDEAIAAVSLNINEVQRLVSSGALEEAEERLRSILLAIHRCPVVAGFSKIFDIAALVEIGNAIDINVKEEQTRIKLVASLIPSTDRVTHFVIENEGETPTPSVVEQINNRNTRQVSSTHDGSGEALKIIQAFGAVLNRSQKQLDPRRVFHAGTRPSQQPGFYQQIALQIV